MGERMYKPTKRKKKGSRTNKIAAALPQLFTEPPGLLTPGDAESFLEHLLTTMDLLHLFQHYFPNEFQAAQEKHLSFLPEDRFSYSQFEAQFFSLVNQHLFPLPLYDMAYNDPWGEGEYASVIPVEPFGMDRYEDEGYEELPLGWQLVLYLLRILDEECVRANGIYEDDDLFAIELPEAGKAMNWSLFDARCRAQGGPIAYLPLVIEMLDNDTGSVWLDATLESPCTDAIWTLECVDALHEQYLLALDIQAKAMSFCDWLEERPVPRLAAVVRLWKSCVRDTPQPSTKPQVRTVTADQFLEGTNFNELFERQIALPARLGGEP